MAINSVWTLHGRSKKSQADDLQVSESDSELKEDYEKSEHEANMSTVVLKHVSKNASLAAAVAAVAPLSASFWAAIDGCSPYTMQYYNANTCVLLHATLCYCIYRATCG